jgi:hypothetical protein
VSACGAVEAERAAWESRRELGREGDIYVSLMEWWRVRQIEKHRINNVTEACVPGKIIEGWTGRISDGDSLCGVH